MLRPMSDTQLDRTFEQIVDTADMSLQTERAICNQIIEQTQAEYRSVWAKAARKRVSVAVNGLRK
jgi:hypothetical protein